MATYERTVPDKAASDIRAAAEKFIRQMNFEKIQGRMVSDGGFASAEIWDGSATLRARVGLLSSREESGKEWSDLVSMVTPLLPKDFVR